ncbi:Argininosuccinate lyase [Variovorax sp. PBS-H4]|uniref:Bug family tripartite tricarboxylate transporter substrate binding protein n=1 Tax=Variovorax sp. PBS-H4 TaxID=434008 RepID=UPI001319231E|nr:tripartite tricarboxylate transporter substrate-binding protein [Variovorax sp. PBS-H4]VTU37594.1 Argininosuccinate lyase [Variovorax sp. PBS-H4]
MKFVSAIAALATSLLFALPAGAQSYPNKPVKLIIGYTAGGSADIVGRMVATELSNLNGQPFVVENRPGVGGMLGLGMVAKAPADGYTLGLGVSGTLVTGPHLQKGAPYDPLADFTPISIVARTPMAILASPEYAAPSVTAILDDAKARPGEVMFASGAQAFELAIQLFQVMGGVKMGSVPYPGGAQASIDVIAGRVPLMVDVIGAQQANIKAGKLRPVAVLDSKRSTVLPDVPTVSESGIAGYEAVGWSAFMAPKGTPEAVVSKLNAQIRQIMAKPDVRDRLLGLGFEPASNTSAELGAMIQGEHAKWGALVKQLGLVAQ